MFCLVPCFVAQREAGVGSRVRLRPAGRRRAPHHPLLSPLTPPQPPLQPPSPAPNPSRLLSPNSRRQLTRTGAPGSPSAPAWPPRVRSPGRHTTACPLHTSATATPAPAAPVESMGRDPSLALGASGRAACLRPRLGSGRGCRVPRGWRSHRRAFMSALSRPFLRQARGTRRRSWRPAGVPGRGEGCAVSTAPRGADSRGLSSFARARCLWFDGIGWLRDRAFALLRPGHGSCAPACSSVGRRGHAWFRPRVGLGTRRSIRYVTG